VFLASDGRHAKLVAAGLDNAGVSREVGVAAGPVAGARVV
jgi:hypothetical protein